MIASQDYDGVADGLQSVKKEHLHVSFASVAADGWQHNASFRDQAWRLARFFDRVSQGSLMAYIPTIRCKTAALLIRTSETHRAEFRGWLAQLSDKALDVEPVDFGASAVCVAGDGASKTLRRCSKGAWSHC
eukprot:m.238272 g.238272  ORF g.238272 m.238272 type:complete len:132 (+) comp15805_c0_seq11:251-646(+)